MADWLKLNPKVAAVGITAFILIFAAPQLAAAGVNITPTWQMILMVLAGYMTPVNGGVK